MLQTFDVWTLISLISSRVEKAKKEAMMSPRNVIDNGD